MISLNYKKSSKYVVSIGWALTYYADSMQDVNNLISNFGGDKVEYKKLEKENN